MLQACVDVALAGEAASPKGDGASNLAPPVVHVLRLVADVLAAGVDGHRWLRSAFRQRGRSLPPLGDPSDPKGCAGAAAVHDQYGFGKLASAEVRRLHDLSRLGLEWDASDAMIRQAFRLRAKAFHPDRHHNEAAGMRSLAQAEFLRCHEAYHRLASHERLLRAARTGRTTSGAKSGESLG